MIEEMPRSVPTEKAASEAQIKDSIEHLTPAETFRLDRYARFRIQIIGHAAADGRDHEDLLQQAVTQFLSGDRKWNRDKSFASVLLGAIKSISSHWASQHNPEQPKTESELLVTREDGSKHSPFDLIPSKGPDPVHQTEIEQLLQRINRLFADDDEALLVIDGWRKQMTGPEIKEDLGLSQTEIETIIRRIRRKITKEFGGHYV